MTESEKVILTTALVDNDVEATPELVAVYLSVAKDAILKRRYPFGMPAPKCSLPEGFECPYGYPTADCNVCGVGECPYLAKANTEMPSEYDVLQCQLAARYFLRRGGEGEVTHSENGINRTYGSVNDSDLLQEIVPFAKIGG